MSNKDVDEEAARRRYTQPHSGAHPIPTVQAYREHRRELQDQLQKTEEAQEGPEDESKPKRAYESAKAILTGAERPRPHHDPYPSANRNYAVPPDGSKTQAENHDAVTAPGAAPDGRQDQEEEDHRGKEQSQQGKSATEVAVGAIDPKEKRKAMKKIKRHGGGREVTDPVTHLPITIFDRTDKDLHSTPENNPEPGTDHWTATGPQGASKSESEVEEETLSSQRGLNGMAKTFPPPEFDDMRRELATVYQKALSAGLVVIGVTAAVPFAIASYHAKLYHDLWIAITTAGIVLVAVAASFAIGQWTINKVNEIFKDEVWDASRREEQAVLESDTELPESVQWLNSFFSAVWPLVNPDLFSGLVDTVEDVLQASLPKVIKMVSIDDMGQGNESIRILGVRWLPTGNASRSVDTDGKLQKEKGGKSNDRVDPNETQDQRPDPGTLDAGDSSKQESKQDSEEKTAIREGLEAEEGDFINLELALAYRSRSSGKSIKAKAKNAHLYLKFYLPGGMPVPVWVEVRGFIATMRVRLQLTPDPPFMSLCTLTFMGQPKASLSCIPLSKHSLNMMDVPLISSFVQSAIDAALSEYVAPKSLTLNLKDMLVGADFKKDTNSKGVVWIFIKRARAFKQGDGGIGPIQGSSDSYVTVSWGKFGKPVASTRIIENEQAPDWHEHSSILVSAEELNAEEKLRLQLWDSDKWTADDDLGRVEVDLKDLIQNPESHNNMQDREDRFTGQDPDEKMAGTLEWSVGYFSKTRITQAQLEQQTVDKNIRTIDQLKKHVAEVAEHKLREAGKRPEDKELQQQRAQDYKELEDNMIISAPPSEDHVSGILSIQVHNIYGLEVQKLQKRQKGAEDAEAADHQDETEREDDMPDSYCTIILNHKKIYRTRVKPKNNKPFFNAGTERFIKDWRDTEVIVGVRDAREREADPLIGMVYLPLANSFRERSQTMDNYPLAGGIGHGKIRISMVWRSVDLKLPPRLSGWDLGTLEIRGSVKPRKGLPENLQKSRLKLRTSLSRIKMYEKDGEWKQNTKQDLESGFLPVKKRYSSPLVIDFRESSFGPDKTGAFAILWLQELVDEEETTKVLKVWKGGKDNQRKAESCCNYQGLDESEQPLGEIEITVRFWRGLSGYHKQYAAKSSNSEMQQVMECLDAVGEYTSEDNIDDEYDDSDDEDEQSNRAAKKKLKVHTNDDSSGSDNSGSETPGSSSSLSLSDFKKVKKVLRNPVDGTIETAASMVAPGHNDPDDGSRGLRNQVRDYKDHHKQLHRKHRGIMQWKVARQADYLGGKLGGKLKNNVSGLFHHGDKDGGAETEV